MKATSTRTGILLLLLFFSIHCPAQQVASEPFPEQTEIDVIAQGDRPEGVVFLIMEQDTEALQWVLPRVLHYTQQLRGKWPDLTIIVLSHGEEMFALQTELRGLYESMHREVVELVSEHDVLFQVCGAYAFLSDIDASQFPDYIDVVPSAPAEIETYRLMGFSMVNLELTW